MRAGLLLSNLGTPDAPTTPALRRYLREFLWDPRVIEVPRWKWWLILNLFVLTSRPSKSAAAYREVWTDDGSPLLAIGRRQQRLLADALDVPVALGMRYGNPSIDSAIQELERQGCTRIVLLPLYPQYCAATTASTMDAFGDALRRRRVVPEVRTIMGYHDDEAYIGALVASIRETWADGEQPDRLLLSFHGIPKRYADAGDPYPQQCARTAELVAAGLGLETEQWSLSFQSRFGREEWLQPYTDETLKAWGKDGTTVDVACPGFAADCLETIEEIGGENRGYFEAAGGGRYRYIAALNDRSDHIEALAAVARRALA